jgi:hypothetical protein
MSSADYDGEGVSDYVVFPTDSAYTNVSDCKPAGRQQPMLVILYRSP